MLLSRIAPSARIVSIKPAYNVKPTKYLTTKAAWYHGEPAIMPITPTASANGPLKRKTPALYARRLGQPLKLPNNDPLSLII